MNEQNNEGCEEKSAILTPKEIEIFTGFAATLKRIHIRIIASGYTITADGIVPLKDEVSMTPAKRKRRAS